MRDEPDFAELSALLKAKTSRYAAPSGLRQSIHAAVVKFAAPPRTASGWRERIWLKLGVAFACGVVASVLATQLYSVRGREAQVGDEVVAAHVRSLQVAHLEDVASTDQHTVKPWFAGKLDFSPPVNDLSRQGFPLAGGRLDYIDRHFAAALVYRRNGHAINVFVWPARSEDEAKSLNTRLEGFNLIAWRDAGMQFCVVSDLNADELQQFSRLLRAAGG